MADDPGGFYRTDPGDPDAPVALEAFGGFKIHDYVVYADPSLARGLTAPMRVNAIYQFPADGDAEPLVQAVVDGGRYEINAYNLRHCGPRELERRAETGQEISPFDLTGQFGVHKGHGTVQLTDAGLRFRTWRCSGCGESVFVRMLGAGQ